MIEKPNLEPMLCMKCGVSLSPWKKEVMLAGGRWVWLCTRCRTAWHEVMDSHHLSHASTVANSRVRWLEVSRVGGQSVEETEFLAAVGKCEQAERDLFQFSREWLKEKPDEGPVVVNWKRWRELRDIEKQWQLTTPEELEYNRFLHLIAEGAKPDEAEFIERGDSPALKKYLTHGKPDGEDPA